MIFKMIKAKYLFILLPIIVIIFVISLEHGLIAKRLMWEFRKCPNGHGELKMTLTEHSYWFVDCKTCGFHYFGDGIWFKDSGDITNFQRPFTKYIMHFPKFSKFDSKPIYIQYVENESVISERVHIELNTSYKTIKNELTTYFQQNGVTTIIPDSTSNHLHSQDKSETSVFNQKDIWISYEYGRYVITGLWYSSQKSFAMLRGYN